MQANLSTIFDSPAWRTQNSLLIITFDEDDEIAGGSGNVVTILIGPSVRHGLTSYASRTTLIVANDRDAWSLAPLTANDIAASPMTEFFTTGP